VRDEISLEATADMVKRNVKCSMCRSIPMVQLTGQPMAGASPLLMGIYDCLAAPVNGAHAYKLRLLEPLVFMSKNYEQIHMIRDPSGVWAVGPAGNEFGTVTEAWLKSVSPSTDDTPESNNLSWHSLIVTMGLWVPAPSIKCVAFNPESLSPGDRVEFTPDGSHTRQEKPFNGTAQTVSVHGTVIAVSADPDCATATCTVKYDDSEYDTLMEIAKITADDVLRSMVLRGLTEFPQPLDSIDLNDAEKFPATHRQFFFELFHIGNYAMAFEDIVQYFFASELQYLCDVVEREDTSRQVLLYPLSSTFGVGRKAVLRKRESFVFTSSDEKCLAKLDSIFVTSLLGCSPGFAVLLERIERAMTSFPARSAAICEQNNDWDFFPGGHVDKNLLRNFFAGSSCGLSRLRHVLLEHDGALLETLVPESSTDLYVGDVVECHPWTCTTTGSSQMCMTSSVLKHLRCAFDVHAQQSTATEAAEVTGWQQGVIVKNHHDGTFDVSFDSYEPSDDASQSAQTIPGPTSPFRRIPQFFGRRGRTLICLKKTLGASRGDTRLVAHYHMMVMKSLRSNPRVLEYVDFALLTKSAHQYALRRNRHETKSAAEIDAISETIVRKMVLSAVSMCGQMLRFAPLRMRQDKEIVMAAVHDDPHAWNHADLLQETEADAIRLQWRAGLEEEHAGIVAARLGVSE
jgi:hypothetical protein